jgi:hypothetical protein
MRFIALVAGWVALAPFAAMPALSQGSPQSDQNEMSNPMSNTTNVPDQKLDATANAIQHVESVREDYDHRLTAAQPSDRDRLVEEGQQAMVKAVTDQGLSVQEYNSILEAAQSDPEVRERLVERIQKNGGPGAGDSGGDSSSGQ